MDVCTRHVRRLTAVDPYVVATEFEKGCDVLEDEAERVRLPVVCIVAELDTPLDVYVSVSRCPSVVSARKAIPMSICFRKVQSMAVPMV